MLVKLTEAMASNFTIVGSCLVLGLAFGDKIAGPIPPRRPCT